MCENIIIQCKEGTLECANCTWDGLDGKCKLSHIDKESDKLWQIMYV